MDTIFSNIHVSALNILLLYNSLEFTSKFSSALNMVAVYIAVLLHIEPFTLGQSRYLEISIIWQSC